MDAPGGPGLLDFVTSGLRRLEHEPTPPSAVLLTACGPDETAGLKELVEKCHPEVVAAPSGIPRVRGLYPAGTVPITPEDLAARGWFSFDPIPLEGRGWSPIAYRLTLSDKSILVFDRIPVKLSQAAGQRLIADLLQPPGDIRSYFTSLTRLHQGGSPDLWLPAVPTHGQNANLYDRDWYREIEENLIMLRSILSSAPRR